MTGFSGFCRSLFSLMTSVIRFALASDIVIITNTMESIIRLIRIFMQYARRLISSPVPSSSTTMRWAPNQLIRRMQLYTTVIMIGETPAIFNSALMNIS